MTTVPARAAARRVLLLLRSARLPDLRGFLPLVALLVAWQLAGSSHSLSFPEPSEWFASLTTLYDQGVLSVALRGTLLTFVLSFAVSVVLGAAAGLAIGSQPTLERALAPLLEFFRSLPPPVVVPVLGLLLGPSLRMNVIVVVAATIWPILLNTIAAVHAIPLVRLETSRTLGLSRFEHVRKVLVPSVVLGALLGAKVAVSLTLVVTLLVEMLGSAQGIGRLILERQQAFDAASVWGLLLIIGVVGYATNTAMSVLEQRVLRNWGMHTTGATSGTTRRSGR